jgi:thiosulfate/3-mercaptopyruvate sulfurtransferase
MLPPQSMFEKEVSELGIDNDTHVVVYDAVYGIGASARVLWTFRVFGHKGGISVLEGGLDKWKAEGRPLESGPNVVVKPKVIRFSDLNSVILLEL